MAGSDTLADGGNQPRDAVAFWDLTAARLGHRGLWSQPASRRALRACPLARESIPAASDREYRRWMGRLMERA
jgi:hypothetical protein